MRAMKGMKDRDTEKTTGLDGPGSAGASRGERDHD